MENSIFRDPKLKLKRANKHISELDSMLRTYCANIDPARVYEDADGGLHSLQFKVAQPMPEDVPLILGDAIHNLRCALDIMTCERIILDGGMPNKWTRFPFHNSRDELIRILNGGAIKCCP
jgi:hypothetical protein